MNSKELMLQVLNGKHTDIIPVTPHWWGIYKFQHAKIASDYSDEHKVWGYGGEALAKVDSIFYETFKPDMLHLTAYPGVIEKNEQSEKIKVSLLNEVRKLDSFAAIDEYVNFICPSDEEIKRSQRYSHVSILSKEYGDKVFIALHEGNPICSVLDPDGHIGFEEGFVAMAEKPEMMQYLIYKLYEGMLPAVKVLAQMGAHSYIGSETYCSSDLISPNMYRDIIFPAQQFFYQSVDGIGLVPITYFLGDINPLLGDIKKLGVKGLMVEESKKTFTLDIGEICSKMEGEVAVFGNLDSVYTMLHGTAEDVKTETIKQLRETNGKSFIMSNGCPLAFDTPKKNIQTMIETVREYKSISR